LVCCIAGRMRRSGPAARSRGSRLPWRPGRDGFWLARWLAARGVEAHVIQAPSVAVSREHRRAKTDRLDTELLKRAFSDRRFGAASNPFAKANGSATIVAII
jgi:transposase